MKKYQKKLNIEVVKVLKNGDVIVQNEGDSSDKWTIDKLTFEKTYEEVKERSSKFILLELIETDEKFRVRETCRGLSTIETLGLLEIYKNLLITRSEKEGEN